MRILETRNLGVCRMQIAEQSNTGWTVTVFPPEGKAPVVFRSEVPSSLEELVSKAQLKAAEFERTA